MREMDPEPIQGQPVAISDNDADNHDRVTSDIGGEPGTSGSPSSKGNRSDSPEREVNHGKFHARLTQWWHTFRRTRLAQAARSTRVAFAIRSSLSFRSALVLTAALLVIMVVFTALVSTQLRTSIFETRREQILEDAARRFSSAQAVFDQSTATSPDQVQEAARQLAASIKSSAAGAGAESVALLRSETASPTFRINQITDAQTENIITEQMREALKTGSGAWWQSVTVPDETDPHRSHPGILVGMNVQLPRAGTYELYIVYSLESDQAQVSMVMRILLIALLPIFVGLPLGVFVVQYRILRPVRSTADAAGLISQGDLSARVPVSGIDEMADLSTAFNEMAESLQRKISEYDELSQLQQRFVSDVSHELRTPLTTIRMADSVIWDNRETLPQGAKRSAELLHDQTERMESMLADLLEISRYDAQSALPEPETTDMRLLIRKVIAAHEGLAQRLNVPVIFDEPGVRCSAEIDSRRIERVLRNLLVNAIEHADGTKVTITVRCTDTDIAVRVRDGGVGMSEETVAHVFDRFFRADTARARTTGGTGLGLSIATEDVRLHGGTLRAWGEIGKGASFVMTLPRTIGQPVSSEPLAVWEEES